MDEATLRSHERSLMPAWLPRVNLKVTNRIQGLWAPYAPGYIELTHVGRTSGKQYTIPLNAFRRGDTLAIALPYGARTQWMRNIVAAGGQGTYRRHGKRRAFGNARLAGPNDPLPLVPRIMSRKVPVLLVDVRPADV